MDLNPEAVKQMVEKAVPFIERTGIKALELKPGRVRLGAPLKGNEATQKGKSEFVLEGEVKDEEGKVVAVSRGIYQLRAVGI